MIEAAWGALLRRNACVQPRQYDKRDQKQGGGSLCAAHQALWLPLTEGNEVLESVADRPRLRRGRPDLFEATIVARDWVSPGGPGRLTLDVQADNVLSAPVFPNSVTRQDY